MAMAAQETKPSGCPMRTSRGKDDAKSLLEHVLKSDMSREEALTLTLEMLAGGIDTTSTCAIFVMYQLCRNQQYQQKLRELAAEPSRKAEFKKWIRACAYEAMRLNPLTYANQRQTDADLVLSGYKVPAGTTVRFTSHLMNLRDAKYFPEPERFLPERWMTKENEHK